MIQTLYELVNHLFPDALEVWDKWDYRISAPLSLDDAPFVQVTLVNANKTSMMLRLPLSQSKLPVNVARYDL
jgi:hypothetical protein